MFGVRARELVSPSKMLFRRPRSSGVEDRFALPPLTELSTSNLMFCRVTCARAEKPRTRDNASVENAGMEAAAMVGRPRAARRRRPGGWRGNALEGEGRARRSQGILIARMPIAEPNAKRGTEKPKNGADGKGDRDRCSPTVSAPGNGDQEAAGFSFFTSTLDLRPLCSYFSRRAGGRSSGVPSTNPPLDWK